MRIHNIISDTVSNGPGTRFAIWVQGCHFNCPGCFNPETHEPGDFKFKMTADDIIDKISPIAETIQGITMSGGEPFDQHGELAELFKKFKEKWPEKDIVSFTGYTHKKLKELFPQPGNALEYVDLLIAGPYNQEKHDPSGLKGSSNQQAIFLTDNLKEEFLGTDIEFIIDEETGDMVSTGFPVKDFFKDGFQ